MHEQESADKSVATLHRSQDLERRGLSRQQIKRLVERGEILRLDRGVYMLPEDRDAVTESHALARVALRVPHAVIALQSALAFHGIGTQQPWQVHILIAGGGRSPRLDWPPLAVFRTGSDSPDNGIEIHRVEGVPVRVTSIARTVADCFKYRNKIGLDIALEALRECLRSRKATPDEIMTAARMNRVERVIRPYMEAMLEVLSGG